MICRTIETNLLIDLEVACSIPVAQQITGTDRVPFVLLVPEEAIKKLSFAQGRP